MPPGSPIGPPGQPPTPFGPPGAPGAFPPPSPPRKSRVGRILAIVGGSLAVVLLLCCGGTYLFIGKDLIKEGNASLSTPDTVAGLKKSTNAQLQPFVDEMSSGLKSDADLDDTIAAFYEDPKASTKLVMLVGGTSLLLRPRSELDNAFEEMSSGGSALTDVTDVDPGELGGVARCGTTKAGDSPVTFCAWADHGSLVIGGFYNRPVNESAELLRTIRKEILQR